MKELIGKPVNATGSCGLYKNREVFGILIEPNVVLILEGDGAEMKVSVYQQTIKEA